MIVDDEYKEYSVPVPMEGSASFFNSNVATEWNFMNYFCHTHNGQNKLKYFTKIKTDYLNDLQKVYRSDVPEKVKDYILLLKNQDIPTKATVKANLAKPKKKCSAYNNSVIINGSNYNNITLKNNTVIGEASSSSPQYRGVKRTREPEDGTEESQEKEEKEEEEGGLWKKWVSFLNNSSTHSKFHPFSPEYHDIIRCGKGVSWKPNLDSELYSQHLEMHEDVVYALPTSVTEYVHTVINSSDLAELKKNIRKLPDEHESVVEFLEEVLRSSYAIYNTEQDLEEGEATFNDMLLYPFLKAVCLNKALGVPIFKVGETPLRSMSKKLSSKGHEIESSDPSLYKADGIISLKIFNNLEVLLLETSNHFGSTDGSKSSFDHHKGLFGALSMLKSIADCYSFGSIKTFKKVKVFFLHAAEKTERLWSIKYVPEGPIYELWLEQSHTINPAFQERAEQIPFTIKFYWSIRCLIEETVQNLETLKKEHAKVVGECLLTSLPKDNLSTVIDCSMLRLTEEEDKTGMFRLGSFYTTQ